MKKSAVNTRIVKGSGISGFPERIGALRDRAELTQVDLAKAVGVDASAVGGWERGTRLPERAETIVRLAEALNTSADYLLTGREPLGLGYLVQSI